MWQHILPLSTVYGIGDMEHTKPVLIIRVPVFSSFGFYLYTVVYIGDFSSRFFQFLKDFFFVSFYRIALL